MEKKDVIIGEVFIRNNSGDEIIVKELKFHTDLNKDEPYVYTVNKSGRVKTYSMRNFLRLFSKK